MRIYWLINDSSLLNEVKNMYAVVGAFYFIEVDGSIDCLHNLLCAHLGRPRTQSGRAGL